jgi:flagellar biosynthetic protein FlhB
VAEDRDQRTLPATERRRREARDRGQFAISRDLSAGVIILVGTAAVDATFRSAGDAIARLSTRVLEEPWLDLDIGRVTAELLTLFAFTMLALAPALGALFAAALAIGVGQLGGVFIPGQRDVIDVSRLNPIAGLGRIFSTRGLAKAAVDLLKVGLIIYVSWITIDARMGELGSLTRAELPGILEFAGEVSRQLAYRLAGTLLVLGLIDYAYQRWQFETDLMMTLQEVKDEMKDLEGDPKIKAVRRQTAIKLAKARMLGRVKDATVVATNPTELAVAIRYEIDEDRLPVVVAKGAGPWARRIRELAAEHDIPIIENKPLARLLYHRVEPDHTVPDDALATVAEILVYVYRLKGRAVRDPGAS